MVQEEIVLHYIVLVAILEIPVSPIVVVVVLPFVLITQSSINTTIPLNKAARCISVLIEPLPTKRSHVLDIYVCLAIIDEIPIYLLMSLHWSVRLATDDSGAK